MIIERDKIIDRNGYDKFIFIFEVKDKRIEISKIRELIESEDFLDKEGKFDTETFLEEIENRRTYNIEITKSGNKIIKKSCDCKWSSLEEARTSKTNKDCRHIKEVLEVMKNE